MIQQETRLKVADNQVLENFYAYVFLAEVRESTPM